MRAAVWSRVRLRYDAYGTTLLVDRTVEIYPAAVDLYIRLVRAPRTADHHLKWCPAPHELASVSNHPAQDRRRRHRDTQLCRYGCEITIAEPESQIPAHTQNDHFVREPSLLKQWIAAAALPSHFLILRDRRTLGATEPCLESVRTQRVNGRESGCESSCADVNC
jgi:hypothetical protein